jgi:hypothetical protein
MEGGGGAVPAWAPAYVAKARALHKSTDADLSSGRAWAELLERMRRAGEVMRSERAPSTPAEQAAGYRHLLGLLSLGIDEALRRSDPHDPFITPGNVDAVLKWGMDCPDASYLGAALRGEASYRVTGNRGTVRYLGLQVMSGMETSMNVVADDLDLEPGGDFELVLSAEEHPGNWMALPEGSSSLIVRQFFYDWLAEEPARLDIERLGGPRPGQPEPLSAAATADQLVALGEFVEASLGFWLDVEEAGRAESLNSFKEPSARTDIGGAAENVTVWGHWELEPEQALLIEVGVPEALYWSVSLGNHWWESIDYADHQSSLNGHQAWVDGDGVFRAVVCQRDPGIANWLDTAGFRRGPMIFRWLRASEAPVPATKLLGLEELPLELPSGTRRVCAEERRAVLAARRAGARRRFGR